MSETINTQFVTFQIGDEEYGIDVMLVQEIIRYRRLTKVFNSNPAIKGVMNFRGNVIPIMDMRRKFKLDEIDYDEYTVVIVIEVENKTMGMIVDRVSDIVDFDRIQLQMVDSQFEHDVKVEHLQALAKYGERIIMLLDPSKVMTFEEYQAIRASAPSDLVEVTS